MRFFKNPQPRFGALTTIGLFVLLSSCAGIIGDKKTGSGSTSSTSITSSGCDYTAAWSTSDDFEYVAGKDCRSTAIAADTSGNLYAAGYCANGSDAIFGIVRKSTDQGATWSTVLDYQNGGNDSYFLSIAITSTGVVFVAGYVDKVTDMWLVIKTTNGGNSWTVMDEYLGITAESAAAQTITVDSSNNIYVIGTETQTTDTCWTARKSTDGGSTWSSIIDDCGPSNVWSANVISVPTDGTVLMGFAELASFGPVSSRWNLKTLDFTGLTATALATYQESSKKNAQPLTFVTDSLGRYYLGGFSNDVSNYRYWTVRSSSDFGANWTTIDHYQAVSQKTATANASVRSSSTVFVSGFADNASNIKQWITRSAGANQSFSTIDTYQLDSANHSASHGITKDSSSNIFASGYGTDSSAIKHWIVRKLSCD